MDFQKILFPPTTSLPLSTLFASRNKLNCSKVHFTHQNFFRRKNKNGNKHEHNNNGILRKTKSQKKNHIKSADVIANLLFDSANKVISVEKKATKVHLKTKKKDIKRININLHHVHGVHKHTLFNDKNTKSKNKKTLRRKKIFGGNYKRSMLTRHTIRLDKREKATNIGKNISKTFQKSSNLNNNVKTSIRRKKREEEELKKRKKKSTLLVLQARFGRMTLHDKCVKGDMGYMGCFSDVTSQVEGVCDGEETCKLDVVGDFSRWKRKNDDEVTEWSKRKKGIIDGWMRKDEVPGWLFQPVSNQSCPKDLKAFLEVFFLCG